ncbi:MAG: helix-turn-helix domain-containing protein [Eggerthellaceae bacterium]|jgi:excisionase family DNA binding protein|nr:helix-turn-helix domain-containing protein [Eggerthellaceae bacterium]
MDAKKTGPEEIGHLMSFSEAAKYLHVSYATVFRLVTDGELKAFRIKKNWRKRHPLRGVRSQANRRPSPDMPVDRIGVRRGEGCFVRFPVQSYVIAKGTCISDRKRLESLRMAQSMS